MSKSVVVVVCVFCFCLVNVSQTDENPLTHKSTPNVSLFYELEHDNYLVDWMDLTENLFHSLKVRMLVVDLLKRLLMMLMKLLMRLQTLWATVTSFPINQTKKTHTVTSTNCANEYNNAVIKCAAYFISNWFFYFLFLTFSVAF